MKVKKIIISFMVTIALLIPISRSPNNPIILETKAAFVLDDFLGLALSALIIGAVGYTVGNDTIKSNFERNMKTAGTVANDIYNELTGTITTWYEENNVSLNSQGIPIPLMIPKTTVQKFNKEVYQIIDDVDLNTVAIAPEVLEEIKQHPLGGWFDYNGIIEEVTMANKENYFTNTWTQLHGYKGSLNIYSYSQTKYYTEPKVTISDIQWVTGQELYNIFIANPTKYFNQNTGNYIHASKFNDKRSHISYPSDISLLFNNGELSSHIFPIIRYSVVVSERVKSHYSDSSEFGQTIYGYTIPMTHVTSANNSYNVIYSLQHMAKLQGYSNDELVLNNGIPDVNGNNSVTDNSKDNIVINNFYEYTQNSTTTVLDPNSWADSKNDDDVVIPSYTGSLPTLQNGVLTNTDGSVYPLPQFPTPSIDVSWDILATLQNLFSWLAAVLKWIVDMGIYGLYMILAQLGLTQFFNLVLTFLRSILDLITSFFKFLFKALATIPDFFKFIIALLALIFDSILKFINLIITLIIHTFYDLINSALLSYTSITRLLPSPLNTLANATVSLVTSFLTFKVIKNIIGGLRS